jgi:hypothetical protein
MNDLNKSLRAIDWKWVGIGYCCFVVFHLLPSYLLVGYSLAARMEDAVKGVWLFLGLAPIAFYIGYRSRGVTILEPAISAIFYDITLLLEFRNFWGRTISHSWGIIYFWALATLLITITCAWLGEIYQARKESKSPAV